eukprot:gnl/Spiro4/27253_TR13552_c0_g1_i1.p1 gnl/Spiro4/27253_TR13552_c0_g1~~gnl/Spiro4/27253_TR13552_c0_g1_i1.p1  ORF type:complete len:258 (-),score=67.62 gnl/Spiro4/27253_TR13552_c0_g1_i1:76-849(-)
MAAQHQLQDRLGADERLEMGIHYVRTAYRAKCQELEALLASARVETQERSSQLQQMDGRFHLLEQEAKQLRSAGLVLQSERDDLIKDRNDLIDLVKRCQLQVQKLEGFKRAILGHVTTEDSKLQSSMQELLNNCANSAASQPHYATQPRPVSASADYSMFSNPPVAASGNRDYLNNVHSHMQRGNDLDDTETKEFFRTVRNRLSREQYEQLFENIKRLTMQAQTPEETLRNVQSIFWDHDDLFRTFKNLLISNHVMA